MRDVCLIIAIVFLSGCAEYRALVSTYGEEGADAQLEMSEWGLCKVPSSGALERRYHLFTDPTNPKSQSPRLGEAMSWH